MTPEEERYLRRQGHVVGKDRPVRGAIGCVGVIFSCIGIIGVVWEMVRWDWQLVVLVGVVLVLGIASGTGSHDDLSR